MGHDKERASARGHPFDDLGKLRPCLPREHQFSPPAEACSSGPFFCPPESGGGPVYILRLPSLPHGPEKSGICGIDGYAEDVRSGGKEGARPLFRQERAVGLETYHGISGNVLPRRADIPFQAGMEQGLPYAVEDERPQRREGRDQLFECFIGKVRVRDSGPRLLDAHGAPEVACRGHLDEELGRPGTVHGGKVVSHATPAPPPRCRSAASPSRPACTREGWQKGQERRPRRARRWRRWPWEICRLLRPRRPWRGEPWR